MVTTDGEHIAKTGPGLMVPYTVELRAELLAFLDDPARAETEPLDALERVVTDAHVQAVEAFMTEHQLDATKIDLVGLHGQTVWHRPERRFTRQLMRGDIAAAKLGIDTVTRFRHADVAAGGQGAPFAPLYHKALATELPQPLMVLNLGGVANVTYIDGDTVIAFDTGPASALIDDWMMTRRGTPFDANGALDRQRMRTLAFSQPASRQQLEAIVHPLVGQLTGAQVDAAVAAGQRLVVFDIPLLIESGHWRRQLDAVVVVDCRVETQIRRVMARNALAPETIDSIIAAQASRSARRAGADLVLYNDALSLQALNIQVQQVAAQFGL